MGKLEKPVNIYRERIIAYVSAGVIAVVLGFWPNSSITPTFQPAVVFWVGTTLVMIVWAHATMAFRDPIKNILGLPLWIVSVMLGFLGLSLISVGIFTQSIRLGTWGWLCMLFAVDCLLSKRESFRRYEISQRSKSGEH